MPGALNRGWEGSGQFPPFTSLKANNVSPAAARRYWLPFSI